jgi:opacity protein-like surface antigen
LNGDVQGIIAGAHVGYNRQFDRWVVGLEGAIDPTLITRRLSILVPNTGADPDGSLGIGAAATGPVWSSIQGSLRARAGYALDRVLFYGSGGAAFGAFGSAFQLWGIDLNLAPFYAANMHSSTRVGWTAGGGVEYAINPHWSVRGEYRYSDFGHLKDFPAPSSLGVSYAADRRLDQNQVQLGLSYKFGEWAQAAPVAAKY